MVRLARQSAHFACLSVDDEYGLGLDAAKDALAGRQIVEGDRRGVGGHAEHAADQAVA